MLVTCKVCKQKIERDTAYKIVVNGKNQYYCNEKEYLDNEAEKKAKIQTFSICNEVLGNTTNTILFKELTELSKIHSYLKISKYLIDNLQEIQKFMNKTFNNEYGKIKYFTTIIKNNIGDYISEIKENVTIEMETTEVNYKARPRKKSLSQYMAEYEEG